MKRLLCDLLAFGVLVGGVGQAKGQPGYSYTTLAGPDGLGAFPFGINNYSQIVGGYVPPVGARHPFLLSGGPYTTPMPVGFHAYGTNATCLLRFTFTRRHPGQLA